MRFLQPNWPSPTNVFAVTTTRHHGVSKTPFDSNNLGLHVNDNPRDVMTNRLALKQTLQLPNEPEWLTQTHSTDCVIVEKDNNRTADASITRSPHHVLAIMTADCLPILLCNKKGDEIAAIHAGWRGLLNGVIQNTLAQLNTPPEDLMAWIGPAICKACYEVGNEVKEQFESRYPISASYFAPHHDKWVIDLPGIAEAVMRSFSLPDVFQSNVCTFEEKNDFFSYRRTPETGRIATLIWFNKLNQD